MYELIKSSLQAYAFAAVFSGLWILLVVYGRQSGDGSPTIRGRFSD